MLSHWDREVEARESIEWLRDLALSHLEDVLQDPQCAALYDLVDRREWHAVVGFEPVYSAASSVSALIELRQVLAFFSKNKSLELGIDTEGVARTKFYESEAECKLTNECFTAWEEGRFQFAPLVEAVLHGAVRKISQILGEVPALSDMKFRFGPGAAASIPKRLAHARLKLSTGVQCSEDLLPLVPSILREIPAYLDSLAGDEYEKHGWEWKSVQCEIQHGRLGFVAKNAKTDRGIVVEPLMNTFVQQGIGHAIAERLRHVGQDIKDQTRNARLAREGSLTGALATLDLSSASDTISKGIVAHLLPYDWWCLLVMARTSIVKDGDRLLELEKFSSMGNGFTFPLETLIFYSLALATCQHLGVKGDVSVYGDDIIIPTDAAAPFMGVLKALGFIPNLTKSFWQGEFRESCGKDYFRGIDIRPCYVKTSLSPAAAFVLHNYYVRQLRPEFAQRVLSWIPQHLRIWGPPMYGDGHLHGKWNGVRKPSMVARGYSGWTFESFSLQPRKSTRVLPGDFLYPGYSIYVRTDDEDPDEGRDLMDCEWEPVRQSAERAPLTHQTRKGQAWEWNTSLPGRGKVRKLLIYTLEQPDFSL